MKTVDMNATGDDDISRITIVGEIAPNKVNIPAGDEVKNFFVLLISLKRKEFDEKTVEFQGLNLHKSWENLIVAVGGVEIEQRNTLDEQVEVNEKRQKLKKEITSLKSRHGRKSSRGRSLSWYSG